MLNKEDFGEDEVIFPDFNVSTFMGIEVKRWWPESPEIYLKEINDDFFMKDSLFRWLTNKKRNRQVFLKTPDCIVEY